MSERRLPPLAIMLLLHIYAYAESIRNECAPAQSEWLLNFMRDGLIRVDITSGSGYRVTVKGEEWVERILGTLPPRAYGGNAPGFMICHKPTTFFSTIEEARVRAMNIAESRQGCYILKPIELLELCPPAKPNFQTIYLS